MTSADPAFAVRMVFSQKKYVATAIAVAAAFWILFNFLDQLLFFSPFLNFYYPLPGDAIPGFILSIVTSALMGIIVAMNMYIIRDSRRGVNKSSLFSGSFLGTASSMCASCSSVGFYLVTTFGAAGVATSSFLSNYQIPLRLIAIGFLIWAYYSAHRKITRSCRID